MKWLRSGLRRDVCVVVAAADGDIAAQECKTRLESHYNERIEPRTFYGAVEALVDAGHLVERVDGIHERYALTDAGERALQAHHAWLCEALDG